MNGPEWTLVILVVVFVIVCVVAFLALSSGMTPTVGIGS